MKKKWILAGVISACAIIVFKFSTAWLHLQDDVALRIQDEFDLGIVINIGGESSIRLGDWVDIEEFLESLDGIKQDRIDQIRALVATGRAIEIDFRYHEDGLPHSFRLWIQDGRMLRHFEQRSGFLLVHEEPPFNAEKIITIDTKGL